MSKSTKTKKNFQRSGSDTPWGVAQSAEPIAEGITFFSTASHGGYYVCPELNKQIPLAVRRATFCENGLRGWYEEDCDWAIVVFFFKQHFEQQRIETAIETLKTFHPAVWHTLTT